MESIIKQIYDEIKDIQGGNVADYIPQLAKVNPELFGISVCTMDGKIINIGDTSEEFCLQSCSKPLSYCLARKLHSLEYVHKHVGYEPSGRSFNAFVLNRENLPHNPLINSGAIMVSSLIEPKKEPSERFEIVKNFYQELCGNVDKVGFDNSVYLSEKHHADRNMSLAYYMRQYNAFEPNVGPAEIKNHLDLYFQCCSITINTKIGAVIAATLANGGKCPITSKQIFDSEISRDCLSLMYMCGMYDYSGQFAYEIGLPAKSGVSGCLFLVIPNKMGICIWSPKLDDLGNTVKGVNFCKKFVKLTDYKYHIFHTMVHKENNIVKTKENLISAAAEGDIDKVKILTKELGTDVADYDKRTPLHLAAAEGNLKIVEYLLTMGVVPNIHDRWGNTPLHEAKLHLKKTSIIEEQENYKLIINLLSEKIDTDSE